MILESWSSNQNRQERHFFIPGGDRGYQHNTYVFGYNPEVIPQHLADRITRMIEEEVYQCAC